MGGNAFPKLGLQRVQRQYVEPTVKFVVDSLQVKNFDLPYAMSNLMGSAGKQEDSGDLDFALNTKVSRFVGEPNLPVFDLKEFASKARAFLPEGYVSTKTLKGGQFQSAWPVAGDPSLGLVQVDFVAGNAEWLKFSHYSPGKDVSPYKGVLMSTMLGVLAKMQKDFELYNGDQRVARVGLRFDLERGLYRDWRLQLRDNQGMSRVSADEFETAVATSPRFARLNSVTEPEEVLRLLFGSSVLVEEVDTFEKLVSKIRQLLPSRFQEARERFLEAAKRSAAANDYTPEELSNLDVWF